MLIHTLIPVSELYSLNCYSLYQEEGKSQDEKTKLEEQKESWCSLKMVNNEWKTLYKKQVGIMCISEGLTGHEKALDVVIFINFLAPTNQFYINET